MAQAKRSGASGSSSSSKSSSAKRPSGTSRKASQARKSSSSRSGSRSSSSGRSTSSKASSSQAGGASSVASDPRVEAAAQRLRKLNERIIEASKSAGEGALTNYEKALKTIATTIERGAGSSDVEWISSLATAQANFIRDVTSAWTKAARDMLK